jgi:hypothetical protein
MKAPINIIIKEKHIIIETSTQPIFIAFKQNSFNYSNSN